MAPKQLMMAGLRATSSSTRVGVALWRGILREARVLDADPVRRSLLASPLLRAERSPTETPLPASVEHPDAERALVGAVAELRVTGRSTDVVASPVRFRDALSRQLAAWEPEDARAWGRAIEQIEPAM